MFRNIYVNHLQVVPVTIARASPETLLYSRAASVSTSDAFIITSPEVTFYSRQDHPFCARALVRRGKWIATHLDEMLATFGQVGGTQQLPLVFGNALQEGDEVVSLHKNAQRIRVGSDMIRVYQGENNQPK